MLKIVSVVFQVLNNDVAVNFPVNYRERFKVGARERIHCVSAAPICQWSSPLSPFGVQRLHMALVAVLFCSSSSSKQDTIKLRDI